MADPVTVTVEPKVTGSVLERFWELYHAAFEPLETLSAARQVLTEDEFTAEMADPRVDKYIAWDGDEAVGLATLTRALETVPWISPKYFRTRYPEYAARDALFYLGFILTHPRRRRGGASSALLNAVIDTIRDADGLCGYDIGAYNRDELRFADNLERFIKRRAPATVEVIDEQTYYLLDLSTRIAPAHRSELG